MELGINPNTIQKAYRRMEAEGMILSIPGRGSFVSDDLAQMLAKEREDQLEKTRQMILLCREMGWPLQKIQELAAAAYEEGESC